MMNAEQTYKLKVKNGSGWRAFSTVRLMISVGQTYHEGEKFRAVIDWLNRNGSIKKVHISVNDFLQRHNYVSEGASFEAARVLSTAMGNLWVENQMDLIEQIHASREITRWEEWLDHPNFKETFEALSHYEKTDASFHEKIEEDSHRLLDRRLNRGERVKTAELFIKNSKIYIREEIAVFALQCKDLPGAEIYPGSNLASLDYLVRKTLPSPLAPLATRHFTRIDFARIDPIQAERGYPISSAHIAA